MLLCTSRFQMLSCEPVPPYLDSQYQTGTPVIACQIPTSRVQQTMHHSFTGLAPVLPLAAYRIRTFSPQNPTERRFLWPSFARPLNLRRLSGAVCLLHSICGVGNPRDSADARVRVESSHYRYVVKSCRSNRMSVSCHCHSLCGLKNVRKTW
jgi:hypothetical protein